MCCVNTDKSVFSSDLQATSMLNVWLLFETFHSAFFSVVKCEWDKRNTRTRGTKCGCSEQCRKALILGVGHIEHVLVTQDNISITLKCYH